MPSILVVEQEPRSIERIREALTAEGWKTRVVGSQAEALQAGASEAPDLVVVSADIAGIEAVASSFSRSAGGPGVVALLGENAAQSGVGGIEADELLAEPFSNLELQTAVRRALAARRTAGSPAPPPAAGNEPKLTSRDIFGDMLAEVEKEVAATPGQATANQAAAARRDQELNRKLEQTLSGVLGFGAPQRPKPAAPAPPAPATGASPPKRPAEAGDELDALISRTLSGLGSTARSPASPSGAFARPAEPPASPAAAAPAPPRPQPPPPVPVAPPPATVPEARKPARTAADLDLSALEEMARPRRRAEPPPAAPVAPPVTQAPVASPPPAADAISPPAPPAAGPAPQPAAPAIPSRVPPAPPAAPRSVAPPVPAAPPHADAPMATQQIPIAAGGQQAGERFGQYTLQEKIAAGGMAEVWKARMRGVEGFQKTVAIKKILPHLTDNSEFIGMFIDEAKLAAQLTTPTSSRSTTWGRSAATLHRHGVRRGLGPARHHERGAQAGPAAAARLGAPRRLAALLRPRLRAPQARLRGRELGLVHRDVSP